MQNKKPKFNKKNIEDAIVYFPWREAQGIIIQSSCVLTVAHALEWDRCEDCLAIEEESCPQPMFHGKQPFLGFVGAIEMINDIAVVDHVSDRFAKEYHKWWRKIVNGAPCIELRKEPLPLGKPFSVWTFTHEEEWVAGEAELVDPMRRRIHIRFKKALLPETSGSPVVDDEGRVVSVIANGPGDMLRGENHPLPLRCLPVSIVEKLS